MKHATRKYSWETARGTATATISATAGVEIVNKIESADGWEVPTSTKKAVDTVEVVVNVSGLTFSGYPANVSNIRSYSAAGVVGLIGKVGLKQHVYDDIMSLISDAQNEVHEDADWQKNVTRQRELNNYDDSYNMIASAMAE